MLQFSTVLFRLFGYPYNNDLVICKDSPDYLHCTQIFLLITQEVFLRAMRVPGETHAERDY